MAEGTAAAPESHEPQGSHEPHEPQVAEVAEVAEVAQAAEVAEAVEAVAYADCVLCAKPTEYPRTVRGATLCPVCEWQEAQRTACSG
ncbi:hypothetical protein ACIOJD_19445 [Streptomyces sp. NPDC088116]|uniref:hypothetical protein n=1 Tax=Streptomyces sp. NPDC088116 TaxID=3365825 RepID=UPI00382717E8